MSHNEQQEKDVQEDTTKKTEVKPAIDVRLRY